jgi:protein-S-isoprenylcysteine O-methyltransferase Ste14
VTSRKLSELAARIAARGGIVLFFVMALEVMIMISPFAFFFYSVFNPVFNWLDRYAATRWLTAFYLPHMILPPTLLLQSIRVLGSVLFVLGMATFLICALQVYLGKILRRGVATRGLYAYIRHPQYLALGVWGAGMSILWPRFIVLACLGVMFMLYYFLAIDEEARMRLRYGQAYKQYEGRTGRFFPKPVETWFGFIARVSPVRVPHSLALPVLILATTVGTGFLCRAITLSSLAYESKGNVTLVCILPEDTALSAGVVDGILRGTAAGRGEPLRADREYLGYLMPADYIMQGMIADTGDRSHLYQHHQTVGMITDWVLHPFEHLRRPPSAQMAKMHHVDPVMARRHHCPLSINEDGMQCDHCPYRRVILVEVVRPGGGTASGSDALSLDAIRTPIEVIDINALTGQIVSVAGVSRATAWKDVPTPAI